MSSRIMDALGITGAALLVIGTGWIYPPAGVIVAGILFLSAAIFAARRAASSESGS